MASFSECDASVDPILEVCNLAKSYHVYQHPRDKIKQLFLAKRRQYYRDFPVLNDINFTLAKGEVMGIVGRNGSGKSTLLKLICGVLSASQGKVVRRGRIGALLELGSGFDPEFSGRDNLFMNAALLGLSEQEIKARVDDILAFAQIGSFIDQPVKTYSSGMAMRLAFAIQAQSNPDILVIDEALAVGDVFFQRRCMQRLEELKQAGTSILLVTHNNQAIVRYCDRAMLLHGGRLRLLADPKLVIRVYERLGAAPSEQWDSLLERIDELEEPAPVPSPPQVVARANPSLQAALLTSIKYESNGGEIEAVEVLDSSDKVVNVLPVGMPFSLRFRYRIDRPIQHPTIGCNLGNPNGVLITGQLASWNDGSSTLPETLTPGHWISRFYFHGNLLPDVYFIGCSISYGNENLVHKLRDFSVFQVSAAQKTNSFGMCDLAASPTQMMPMPPGSQ